MYRKIAVAFDGSEGSRRALEAGLNLARWEQAKLWMIYVEEIPRYPETTSEVAEEREAADAVFKDLRKQAIDAGARVGVEVVAEKRLGHPAQSLIHYVKESCVDLLVMGHSGHSKLWGTFLGTTADKVVRHATCSVLVVR